MDKFCRNCGKELLPEQDVCLGCGKMIQRTESKVNQQKNHNTFYTVSSIIMIMLSVCIFSAGVSNNALYGDDISMQFLFPAAFAFIGAIFCLAGKKNKAMLIISGVSYIIGGFINFIAIADISIYIIIAVVFAILNMIFASKMK